MLVSTHPRTRKRLEALAPDAGALDGIAFHDPFGFYDYIRLQTRRPAPCPTAARSARRPPILGFPAVTLRDSIERPEALDAGAIIMTGLDPLGWSRRSR